MLSKRSSLMLNQRVRQIQWVYLLTLSLCFLLEWGHVLIHWRVSGELDLLHSPTTQAFDRFTDWTMFLTRVRAHGQPNFMVNPTLGQAFPYPAPAFFIWLFFIRLFTDSTAAFITTLVCVTVGLFTWFALYVYRRLHSKLAVACVIGTLLMGFPTLFAIDRGNQEVFVWLLTSLALITFLRRQHGLSAVLIGVAASLKFYPLLLCLLFLPRRRYRAIAIAFVVALGTTALALVCIGPALKSTLAGLKLGARDITQIQIGLVRSKVLRWDHSLFGFYKLVDFKYQHLVHGRAEDALQFFDVIRLYSVLAVVLFAGLYLFRIRQLPLLNQYICLTTLALLLPYVSYEYTLMNMYGPAAVLLLCLYEERACRRLLRSRWAVATAVLLAILFAPLYLLALRHYAGQVQALILITLLCLFLSVPLPTALFEDASASITGEAGQF